LLRDPALLELQAKKALEAQRVISTAVAERLAADKHKRDVEAELAQARKDHAAALDQERARHDKLVADSRREIEVDKKAIADLKAQAAKDAAKAKADKDEAARRLRVMSGAKCRHRRHNARPAPYAPFTAPMVLLRTIIRPIVTFISMPAEFGLATARKLGAACRIAFRWTSADGVQSMSRQLTMPIDHDFEAFWISHKLAASIARATLVFFQQVCPDLKTPMSLGGELETLRAAVWNAYEHRFDANPDEDEASPPARPILRVTQ
jgi:hypothetical protein